MEEYEKYLSEEIKDFSKIREILEKNEIRTIPFKIDHEYSINQHNEVLIDFFNIDKKNTVINLNEIFFAAKKEYNYYYPFPLEKIYKKQEMEDEKDYYKNKYLEILLPYIKEYKYFDKIIEPLKYFVENKYKPHIHLNDERNKLSLTVYKYKDKNKELEIIETDHVSKNPIYGLLNYFNLDSYNFKNKSLVLHDLETITINEGHIKIIEIFLSNIQSPYFTFNLDIKTSYDSKKINLNFYDPNEKELLSFQNFELEFLVSCLSSFYNLEYLLEYLESFKSHISMYFAEEEIKVHIYNKDNKHNSISIEQDIILMRNLLDDIFRDYTIGSFALIKYIFNPQTYTDNLIKKDFYLNYQTRKYILKEIDGMIQ